MSQFSGRMNFDFELNGQRIHRWLWEQVGGFLLYTLNRGRIQRYEADRPSELATQILHLTFYQVSSHHQLELLNPSSNPSCTNLIVFWILPVLVKIVRPTSSLLFSKPKFDFNSIQFCYKWLKGLLIRKLLPVSGLTNHEFHTRIWHGVSHNSPGSQEVGHEAQADIKPPKRLYITV